MTLGEIIKELRNKKNLSQEKLALELNVSRQAVQKWEQDVCQPSLDTLNAIARLFDVNLDYLVNGNEMQTKDVEKNYSQSVLDKVDIVLLVLLLLSIGLFIGTFIYSVLNPVLYNQSYSFIWWYVRFWVSSGTFFRFLVLLSIVGFVISLIIFLRRRKHRE